jgi:hypothetical protein
MIESVNKEYPGSHKNSAIRVEMDEMRGFYHDKKHKYGCGGLLTTKPAREKAFWFGTREHKNLDKLTLRT